MTNTISNGMITIEELTQVTTEDLDGINNLLPQLSDSAKPLSYQGLLNIVKNNSATTLVIRDGQKLIGFGMLVMFHDLSGTRGMIEDIIVDESYRGKGFGKELMEKLIDLAKKQRVHSIELSSRPDRAAANALYKKLGFEPYETNVYKMKL